MTYSPPAAPPRRRHRGLRIVLIVLLVLVGLVIAADRVGEQVAENLAADKLQSSQGLSSKPDVDITGFPFLNQFATGEYDEVDVHSDNVPLGNSDDAVRLSTLDVALDDLSISRDFATFHVRHATGSGTISYAQLSDTLGVDLRYDGNGRVTASKKITIFGQTITPTVTARASLANRSLTFVGLSANGLGDLAGELADVAAKVFGTGVPLDGIPFEVKVSKLVLTSQGLRIDLAGDDLTYTR